MFTTARSERTRATRKRSLRAAVGPFPRSVWIHPHAPEDELDRVCFKIWKRSVWAKRHIWPHLAENAHRFADDPLMENQSDGSPAAVMRQREIDEVSLMVQREMAHTLQQEHPFQTTDGDCCSLGDGPDHSEEIISREEAQRRIIEKFLKDVLITNREKKMKEVSEGPSWEDFPPLPSATSQWGQRLAQKSPIPIRNKLSPDIPTSGCKSQTLDDLPPPKPQRELRKQKCQRSNPVVFTKTAMMEEVQAAQASKAHNEPRSQLSRSCQSRDVKEAANVSTVEAAVESKQMSKKQGHSDLPVFAAFQAGGKPMAENLPITGGDGLQGKSADGSRVAHDPAGTDTASTREAAGPPQNARSHLFQEDATVLGRKTLSSATDKVGVPVGHMARVQAQPSQCDKAEWRKSSRYFPQKAPLPGPQGPAPTTGMPASGCPNPQRPAHPPPGFTQPQICLFYEHL
ncbi:hypothetical protein SRHO_G00314710, partial [Serrasalmus rhombeus]